MTKETTIQAGVRLLWSKLGGRVFRNNVGEAWLGQSFRERDGSIRIANPVRVKYGLCVGSSDLIGWKPVTITPNMVGMRIAQFVALEVKRPGQKLRPEQQSFLEATIKAGGCGWVVSGDQDTRAAYESI